MRRVTAIAVVLALGAFVAIAAVAGGAGFWKAPPFAAIGINNTYFDNAFAEGGPDSNVIRIWWETGSSTEKCLVTMGENSDAPRVEGINCSSRLVALGDREAWGLMVTLNLAGPMPAGSFYSINAYQEGARLFGAAMPIWCDADGCYVSAG